MIMLPEVPSLKRGQKYACTVSFYNTALCLINMPAVCRRRLHYNLAFSIFVCVLCDVLVMYQAV